MNLKDRSFAAGIATGLSAAFLVSELKQPTKDVVESSASPVTANAPTPIQQWRGAPPRNHLGIALVLATDHRLP